MVNNCSLEVDKAIWEEFVCLPSLYLWYLKCLHFFFPTDHNDFNCTLCSRRIPVAYYWNIGQTTCLLSSMEKSVPDFISPLISHFSASRNLDIISLPSRYLRLFSWPTNMCPFLWKIWICKFYVCMCVRPCFTFIIIMWSQMRAISNTLFATECNFACQQT